MEYQIDNFMKKIMGVLVAIIVLTAVLVPFIESATATEETFTNDGYYYMEKLGVSEDKTVVWSYTDAGHILVDGVLVNLPTQQGSWTIVAGSDFMARCLVGSNYVSIHTYFSDNYGVYADSYDNDEVTITITDSSIIVASNNEGISHTYETSGEIYCISAEKQSYVMKKMDESAYLHEDSPIFFSGRTTSESVSLNISGNGSIEDGITLHQFFGTTATFTDPVITANEVNGYVDLYKFDKIAFSITQGGNTIDATYNYVIVPTTVTAELESHATPGQIALFNAIPVLIIMGILMWIARTFYTNKSEEESSER